MQRASWSILIALLSGCAALSHHQQTCAVTSKQSISGPIAARTTAPAQGKQLPSPENQDERTLPRVSLTSDLLFQLLSAELTAQRSSVNEGAELYIDLAEQTGDPRLAERAMKLALLGRATQTAMRAARVWYTLAPEKAEDSFVAILGGLQQYDTLESVLKIKLDNARTKGHLDLAYAQVQKLLVVATPSMRPADRRAMGERLSAKDVGSAAAQLMRAELNLAAGQYAQAFADAIRALELEPDSEAAIGSIGTYGSQLPDGAEQGIKLAQTFLSRHPRSAMAKFALASLLLADRQPASANDILESISITELSPNNLLFFAQLTFDTKHFELCKKALKLYLTKLEAEAKSAEKETFGESKSDISAERARLVAMSASSAKYFMGQIAEKEHDPEKAIAWYNQVTSGPQRLTALTRQVVLLAKTISLQEARTFVGQLESNSISDAERALLDSSALEAVSQKTAAWVVLEQALQASPNDTRLLMAYAGLSDELGYQERWQSALRRVITLNPNDAVGYNALGYVMADHAIDLDEAKDLIEQALSLAPADPQVLDSMGWVLFRQNQSQEALPYLEQAYAIARDSEIGMHLGEVLWTQGKVESARQTFREALEKEPDNSALHETLTRLGVDL